MKRLSSMLVIGGLSVLTPLMGEAGERNVVLADFERRIPCSECGDPVGFRREDVLLAELIPGGPAGSRSSLRIPLTPWKRDLFFQGRVRRMYLSTQSEDYAPNGPNALSFWIRLPEKSCLTAPGAGKAFGVWTYHWRPGDLVVGGKDNQSLATDSMMHGYAFFSFEPTAAGKWLRIVLTAQAFQICRYYYHFYAGQATTDDLAFFPSLRQLQLHFGVTPAGTEHLQIDRLELIHLEPTALVYQSCWETTLPADTGTVHRAISISNPTSKDRRYRVFISSCIGVNRGVLQRAFAEVDGFTHTRHMQAQACGDGGIGVVELQDADGTPVIAAGREIAVEAGGVWKGVLVYRLKPEMLGPELSIDLEGRAFSYRRDTLTTSLIVWDPGDKGDLSMDEVNVLPSNADDGNHEAPPGFPKQIRLPEGWRSEDIPLDQVGGSFVSVIRLSQAGGKDRTCSRNQEVP